jgi:plastocyanin
MPLRAAASLALVATVLAGCGGSGARSIEVRMRYSRYLPATIAVKAGTTVEFVLVNADPIAHEFIIGTAAEQAAHELAPATTKHTGPGQASIPADTTVRMTYTFAKAGSLIYACHRRDHYAYGMRGLVTAT